MRRVPRISFIIGLIVLVSLIRPTFALAEEGDTPQIALRVLQASPGATIEIEGGRFEHDIGVKFILFQEGTEIPLGTVLCDDHGEFLASVLLPFGLQIGQYEFRAIDEKNRVAVAPLAIIADENGLAVPREDADALLAPMPTFAPGVSSTPLPGQPVPESADPRPGLSVLPFLLLAGIGILSLIGMRVLKQR